MTQAQKPSFRIGVPTYKRPDDLEKFLDAIVGQIKERDNVKLVVVNDGSHNEEYAKVIAKYGKEVDYRNQKVNKGCGPTRAAAFEGSREDYLVCTDDDCVPPENWMDWLEALVSVNPEVDVFAGNIEPVWYEEPNLKDQLLAIPESYPGPVMSKRGLLTAVGANSVFRRTLYQQVGGIPTEMRGAAEDCCITQRILKAGGTYHLAHGWVIGHKAKNTVRELRGRFYGYGVGGAQYALMEQDWVFAHADTEVSLKIIWAAVKMRTQLEWHRCREQKLPLITCVSFAAMTGLMAFEYERGWQAGLRKFASTYPEGLPVVPKLVDQFVDFSNEAERLVAMSLISD